MTKHRSRNCGIKWKYGAKGRRIAQKTWLWTNSTWQVTEDLKFVNDPMSVGRHIAELNATNNALVRLYVWGLDLSSLLDGAGGVGGLLMVTSHSTPVTCHFAAYDGNGNVAALVSASTGTETARYEYVFPHTRDEPLRLTGAVARRSIIRVTGFAARSNPFRFSTKRTDNTTDLVLYEYRAYSPALGRWLSRDPIGERGGIGLYTYVRNDAANTIDLLGLSGEKGAERLCNPCFDPCGDAKRKGLAGRDVGGVVCCDGKKYSCVWVSGGGAKNGKAKEIIDTCVREHEDTHHDDIDCPPGRRVTRPPYKPGKDRNTEECSAYKAELGCLQRLLGECKGDAQCIAEVQAEINFVNEQIKKYCGP